MDDFCCYLQVRVFTFLIGREVSDSRNAKWMADANRGMISVLLFVAIYIQPTLVIVVG